MSLFLDPDEESMCVGDAHSFPISYASTPSSHVTHDGQDVFDAGNAWAAACNSANETYCVSQPMTWPSQIGLRCSSTPTSTQSMHVDPSLGSFINTAIPVSWPSSTEACTPSAAQYANIRHDSMIQNCYPQSGFLPSQPMVTWNSLQDDVPSFRPIYEMSPGRSEYSDSSQNSCVASSSPYARSEGCLPAGDSPTIKIENDSSHPGPRLYSISNSTSPCTQNVHANLGAVYNSSDAEVDRQPTTPAKMVKVEEKLKPALCSRTTSPYTETYMEGIPRATADDRSKRGYTTPLNAVCACENCGKLFQRTSNLKAHMETHRPDREQPWACQYYGCTRRFVRKTDMTRHQESVHIKSRNFHCMLCYGSFSRKDTLRRHIEDGCPRRAGCKKPTARDRRASGRRLSSHQSSGDFAGDTKVERLE